MARLHPHRDLPKELCSEYRSYLLQSATFCYTILEKIGDSGMLNSKKINNLLRQAASAIEQNGSVDSLFEQLALEIKGDPETIALIHMKLDEYRSRKREALEANQIEFDPNDF